jgi:signal transduction histidine kinase
MSIFTKGLLLVSIPLLCQWVFIALVARVQHISSDAQQLSARTKHVLVEGEHLLTLLLGEETGIRGYAIGGDKEFLRPYFESVQQVPQTMKELRAAVSDRLHVEELDQLEAAVNHYSTLLNEKAEMELAGRFDKLVEIIKSQEGKRRMDLVRKRLDTFLEGERALDNMHTQALARSQAQLGWILLGGGSGSLLATLGLAWMFSAGISRRLSTLIENTRRLAKGTELLAPMDCHDEIGQLDRFFHQMALELKQSRQAILDSNRSLEQRVAERTSQLERVNRDLDQKNQENEMFVYSVSHDLRSPLVNLHGFSQELDAARRELRELVAESSLPTAAREHGMRLIEDDMREAIYFILTAVGRLKDIIEALLRLSRIGRIDYHPREVDVEATVNRILTSMNATIKERDATLVVRHMPTAWADPSALEPIFANLIGNALNYLDRNRAAEIEIGWDPQAGGDTADSGPAQHVYFVKDNGVGIAEEYHAKLFQAFQRLHPTLAAGEGMGLATVRRLVDRIGGRIWFESALGRGSTFYVALPAPATARSVTFSSGHFETRSELNGYPAAGNLVG